MGPLASLRPIMERRGVRCDVEQFHASVNVTFHEFESEVYDQVHDSMWQSLPHLFELLVGDWVSLDPHCQHGIRLLDIGCGTGLAATAILKTAIGSRVASIDLLDTSPSMLRQAAARACA